MQSWINQQMKPGTVLGKIGIPGIPETYMLGTQIVFSYVEFAFVACLFGSKQDTNSGTHHYPLILL